MQVILRLSIFSIDSLKKITPVVCLEFVQAELFYKRYKFLFTNFDRGHLLGTFKRLFFFLSLKYMNVQINKIYLFTKWQ